MHLVTAATIQGVVDQLEVLGPGPALLQMGTIEPFLQEHIIRSVRRLLNEMDAASAGRPELQIQLLQFAVSVVGPAVRVLHPPNELGAKWALEYKARLEAINAEARARTEGK